MSPKQEYLRLFESCIGMRGGWSPFIVILEEGRNLDTSRCNNGHQFAPLTIHQSSILITIYYPASLSSITTWY